MNGDDFDSLSPEQRGAFDAAARDSVFFSLPWFVNYIATVRPTQTELRLVSVSTGDAHAVLPMCMSPRSGLLRSRTLAGVQNYYSPLFGPACDGRPSQTLIAGLVAALGQERCDVLDLRPLDHEAPIFTLLVDGLRRAGWWADEYFCFGNWYLPVEGRQFAQYHDTLPSQLKNTLKRKRKSLDHRGRARLELILRGEKLERAIEAYTTIYNASWKVPEPYADFMPGLIRTCAAEGWLRMGLAYVDDEPAAVQVWIVHGGTASIYKLAYDERFASLSLGSILTAMLMEHAMDVDRVDIVDYLTGDEPYKRAWMTHRRERWGIVAYNPGTLSGLAEAARHFGGHWLRYLQSCVAAGPRSDAAATR
jgi:hypothetical protein